MQPCASVLKISSVPYSSCKKFRIGNILIFILSVYIEINTKIILGIVKRNPLFCMKLNGKIMDFFLLHLIYWEYKLVRSVSQKIAPAVVFGS